MKARTLAIARGEIQAGGRRAEGLVHIRRELRQGPSDRNRALLGIIAESGPESLGRLAELTGRKQSNLSRTLKTMERYGFVQLSRGVRGAVIPSVPYQTISLTLPLSKPGLPRTEAA